MERIYLDNAATTRMDAEVKKAMEPYFETTFGNPGSLHWFGQQARAVVDASREAVAKSIGAQFREIIFTGSATEANNLALRGAIKKAKEAFAKVDGGELQQPLRVIVSTIEHESILDTVRNLEKEGVEIVRIPVDEHGLVDVKKIEAAIDERTVLVSIMYANNEIGSIQLIRQIAEIVGRYREGKQGLP